MYSEETIAAVATAYGEGGIGIIRISGKRSKEILQKIFVSKAGGQIESRKMIYGHITDPETKEIIDEVLAVFFPAPNTYTREDVVEIDCHGSLVSIQKILGLILRSGASLSDRGEFTKRAFLNGRIDLSQAEAVIDLIKAKTDKSFDAAYGQLEGALSAKVKDVRGLLVDLLAKIAVNIDYPDEDIEEVTYRELIKSISGINDMIENLLSTANAGRIIREGLSVVIFGSPNVGKSSLMNALTKENRVIVTEIPGTTRDTIEEMVNIKGIPVKLTDTAGIRDTEDAIEKIGIEKSKEAFNESDLILFMVDGSKPLENYDKDLLVKVAGRPVIVLLNKSDLGQCVTKEEIRLILPGCIIISTAIPRNEGLDELIGHIEGLVYGGNVSQSTSLLITNARHKNLLEQAARSLKDALEMAEKGEPLDFIEIDIKRCWSLLGEIIGETASEDIINEVFANFCLGK